MSVKNSFAKTHLEDELSESIRVFVIKQQSVARVCGRGLEEVQEELVFGRAALEQAEQKLQNTAELQIKRGGSETFRSFLASLYVSNPSGSRLDLCKHCI